MRTKLSKALLFLALSLGLISNTVLSFRTEFKDLSFKKNSDQNLILKKMSKAYKKLEAMSIEEKNGQRFIISIEGTHLDSKNILRLNQVKPGGVILFSSNVSSEKQTQELTSDLQEWASKNNLPPLIICIDEEGGIVERLEFDPVKHSAAELGKIDKEEITRETARETAQKLKKLGINTNLAPVADIAYSSNSIMNQRSFGNTPKKLSKHIKWTVEEYNDQQVLSTLKHFPGHGRTFQDSHEELPHINISKQTWEETDAKPFIAGIDKEVPIILTGHLVYPQITSDVTSQSEVWNNNILRKELGFEGLIISDDIKMKGAGEDINKSAQLSLNNGVDMVIVALEDYSELEFKNFEKEESQNESVKRILMVKFTKINNSSAEK